MLISIAVGVDRGFFSENTAIFDGFSSKTIIELRYRIPYGIAIYLLGLNMDLLWSINLWFDYRYIFRRYIDIEDNIAIRWL